MSSGLHIQPKREFNYKLLAFFVVLCIFGGMIAWYGWSYYIAGELPPIPIPISAGRTGIDETSVSASQKQKHTTSGSQPKFLTIESLNVNQARVFPVGLRGNNEVDMPKNINDVGWYSKSSQPDEDISVVLLSGHNTGIEKDGVFKNLSKLSDNSKITIRRGDDRNINYIVKSVKIVRVEDFNSAATSEITKPIDETKQGVTLISDLGNWIPAKGTYDHRVIVRASEI